MSHITVDLNQDLFGQIIYGVGPCKLSLNPGALDNGASGSLSHKVYKIVYEFGDNSPKFTQKLFAKPNVVTPGVPFSSEPGDPRNFTIDHTYHATNGITEQYIIKITWYWIADERVAINHNFIEFVLEVRAPNLNASLDDIEAHYFDNIHLASSRMFGADNTLLYNFESFNPSYLLPVLVKWGPTPVEPLTKILPSPFFKKYKIQESYDSKNNLNPNIHQL